MPANVTMEYMKAEDRYLKAKTREEKIDALEEMMATIPKHKGTEKMRAEIKSKLAKLRKQIPKKIARRMTSIVNEGDLMVSIVGLTNSGKSTLLRELTNAKPAISKFPYTTAKPEIGMLDYEGVKIQLVEIPSAFERIHMSSVRSSHGAILIYENKEDLAELKKILKDFRINVPFVEFKRDNKNFDKLKKNLWEILGHIKVYCKEPGKKPEKKPIVLKKGSTVKDAAREVHKDFVKYFRFARIWGKSAKYPGQQFGMDHILVNDDIIELHMS